MEGANKMSFAEQFYCAGRIKPSGDRSRHICLPEICIFIVNATEPHIGGNENNIESIVSPNLN